jgi:hypothetical protein
MQKEICILYSAFGSRCISEAKRAAKYSKQFIPKQCDLILHTDAEYKNKEKVFDDVVVEANNYPKGKGHAYKIQGIITLLKNKNYEKILFIDSDAMILKNDFMIPFDMLTKFDIVGVQAPVPYGPSSREIDSVGKFIEIPRNFTEMNTGVLYFNNNEIIVRLMKSWLNFFVKNYKNHRDQGAFRYSLYTMNIKFKKIKRIFNWRFKDVDDNTIILHHRTRVNKFLKNVCDG